MITWLSWGNASYPPLSLTKQVLRHIMYTWLDWRLKLGLKDADEYVCMKLTPWTEEIKVDFSSENWKHLEHQENAKVPIYSKCPYIRKWKMPALKFTNLQFLKY